MSARNELSAAIGMVEVALQEAQAACLVFAARSEDLVTIGEQLTELIGHSGMLARLAIGSDPAAMPMPVAAMVSGISSAQVANEGLAGSVRVAVTHLEKVHKALTTAKEAAAVYRRLPW